MHMLFPPIAKCGYGHGECERGPRLLCLLPFPRNPLSLSEKINFRSNTVDQSIDLLSHIPRGGGGSGEDAGRQAGRQAADHDERKKQRVVI